MNITSKKGGGIMNPGITPMGKGCKLCAGCTGCMFCGPSPAATVAAAGFVGFFWNDRRTPNRIAERISFQLYDI